MPTLAFSCVPSKNRQGYVNVLTVKGWMSVDEAGNVEFSATNADGNYQQFKRNGLALEIAPGDDDPSKSPITRVFIPE